MEFYFTKDLQHLSLSQDKFLSNYKKLFYRSTPGKNYKKIIAIQEK